MSITAVRPIACRACGVEVQALTLESGNPVRHPPFQEQLLARTLLRMACPHCGAEHEHYDRFMWTDLPGRLCAIVLHETERPAWQALEAEAFAVLSAPLREEGPAAVRAFGEATAIRLVFGLEELREKVLCRVHALDDRVVEALKEDLLHGALLDEVAAGAALTFAAGKRSVDVPWADYERAAARREALAAGLPGIFDPRAAWVNAARSRRPPRPGPGGAARVPIAAP